MRSSRFTKYKNENKNYLHSFNSMRSKGFVFSLDAAVAAILLLLSISFLFFSINSFEPQNDFTIASLNESSFKSMLKSGYLLQTLDNNSPTQSLSLLKARLDLFLPAAFDSRLELRRMDLDAIQCRSLQDFSSCFPSDEIIEVTEGNPVPDNAQVYALKKFFLLHQPSSDCNLDATGYLEEAPENEFKKKILLFDESHETAFFDFNEDLFQVDFNVFLNPDTNLRCDQNIDVNISIRTPENVRKAVDVMLVMDRSGSMSWTGQAGSNAYNKVWTERNYAFLTRPSNSGFHDFNTINPGYPGYTRTVSGSVFNDIFMSNNYAYLTSANSDNLSIYNASNMSNPSLSSTLSGFSNPLSATASGNYAYVADGAGLKIVNVSNKAAPSISSSLAIGAVSKVVSDANTLYVITTSSGTSYFFDSSASSVQNTSLKAGGFTVDSSEGTSQNSGLYVGRNNTTQYWAGQSFIPFTSSIQNLSLYIRKQGSPSSALVVSLRSSISGADLVSVSIPAASISSSYGWVDTSFASAYAVTPSSTYYLVLTTATQSSSNYYLWGTNSAQPYADGTGYQQSSSVTQDAFFRIKDSSSNAGQSFVPHVSSLQNFSLYLSKTGSPSNALTVSLRSSILGADLASTTISASNISTSYGWINASFSSPVALTPTSTYYFVLSSGSSPSTAYYSWGANNSNPYSEGTAFKQANQVSSTDAFARYGITFNAGLHLFDISSAPSLNYISSFSTTSAIDLFVSSNYAYLLKTGSLQIVNYSTPSSPSQSSSTTLGSNFNGLFVSGNYAYIASDGNLLEVNVSNKGAPVISRNFYTPYGYEDVFIDSGYAFLASGSGTASFITIDLSSGEKLAAAKTSASSFLDFNGWDFNSDQMGLSYFNSSATTSRQLTHNKTLINSAIYSLIADDGTNIESGIRAATTELTSVRANSNAIKFQVLLSDGQSNSGDSLDAAQDAAALGIKIYTIGFGVDASVTELTNIANATDANYYYASDANVLQEIYRLIAKEISEQASDSNVMVPILDGALAMSLGGAIIQDGNLVFEVGALEPGEVWTAKYTLNFPCNAELNCGVEALTFPAPPDENGNSPVKFIFTDSDGNYHYYPFNVFKTIDFLNRDLRVDIFNGDIYSEGEVYLDVNVFNASDLDTNESAHLRFYIDDHKIPANLLATYNIPRLCGAQEKLNCDSSYRIYSPVQLNQSGVIYATVNDQNEIRECPQGNTDAVHCYGSPITQGVIINYFVWRR